MTDRDRHQSFWTLMLVLFCLYLGIGLGARADASRWESIVYGLILVMLFFRVARIGEGWKK